MSKLGDVRRSEEHAVKAFNGRTPARAVQLKFYYDSRECIAEC